VKNTGITLIALIITIIIMMILVGVTVTIAINTNLFKTSGEMAFKMAIAKLDEQVYGMRELSKQTGQKYNYSGMVPNELKEYIEISDNGILLFIGKPNTKQEKWAKEENVIGKQEYILKTKIEELVSLAKQYVVDGKSTTSSNLLALQYIRRNRYKSDNWSQTAGAIDGNFVKYVDNNKKQSLDIDEIIDPITGEAIDFVHSMASLNACLYTSSLPKSEQYAGWAGDLCTFTLDIYNWYKSGTYTEAELKEYTKSKLGGNSSFGLADILADADAANISVLAETGGDIDDIIYDYYYGNDSAKCKNRYASFAVYLKSKKSSTATTEQGKIYDVSWYFLGKNNNLVEMAYAAKIIGDSYPYIPNVVFESVATCFSEYICERM